MILRSKSCSLPVLTCQYPSEVARLSPSFHPPSWMVIVVPRLSWAPMFNSGRRGSVCQNEMAQEAHRKLSETVMRDRPVVLEEQSLCGHRQKIRMTLEVTSSAQNQICGEASVTNDLGVFISVIPCTYAGFQTPRSIEAIAGPKFRVYSLKDNTLGSIVFTTRFVFHAHAQISITLYCGIL